MASATLLLLFPSSVTWILLMGILQMALAAYKMPEVGNHYLLLALVNAAMLVSFFHLRIARRFDREAWIEEIAPVLRLIILIVYFFSFFHKLNDGFFDRRTSCAVFLYQVTASKLALVPLPETSGALASFLIYAVLLAELAIPVLLIFRFTRGYGILIGIFFHALLGFTHYVFSAFMYAAYILFLPKSFIDGVANRWGGWRSGKWLVPLSCLAFLTLFFFESTGSIRSVWQSPWREAGAYAWAFFSFGLLFSFAYGLFAGKINFKFENASTIFKIRWGLLWIFPMVVFINGLSPYLGLKTANSFNMFSNLVTEGGITNHWLLPAGAIEIFQGQEDLVTVSGANVPSFYSLVQNRVPIPYIELRRRVSELVRNGDRDIHLVFLRKGERVDMPHAENDPYLSKPFPWFLRKFMYFRENLELSPMSEIKCSW